MPYRTKRFSLLPWVGGVNTSLDAAMIPQNELTVGENIEFGVRGSRRMRDGINFNWDNASNGSINLLASMDYWYNTPRSNLKTAIGDDKNFYKWTTAGVRTTASLASMSCTFTNGSPTVACTGHGLSQNEPIVFAASGLPTGVTAGTTYYAILKTSGGVVDADNFNIGTAPFVLAIGTQGSGDYVTPSSNGTGTASPITWSGTPTLASQITLNNRVIIGIDGGNTPRKYDPTQNKIRTLGGNAPQGYAFCTHIGRLWSNDYANPDRLHYTTTGNHEEWNGIGDSGAIDIGVGDGDPVGILGIFKFQGILYVAKYNRLYRVLNQTPETFQPQLVSDGIGIVGPNAWAAIDQDDVMFVSPKGVHSLVGTIAAGDDQTKYLSYKIQETFNTNWTKSRLKNVSVAYNSRSNSVAFAVNDSNYAGVSYSNAIWHYNIPLQSWYVWPNISCQSLFIADDADKRRLYLAGTNGRLAKTANSTNYDVSSTGTNTDISWTCTTGVIYLGDDPLVTNAFKRFSLIYKPSGTHTINVAFKIDNYSTQSFAFSQTQTGGVLGVSFYLGQSALGYAFITAPYQQSIDGYGKAFQLTLTQSGQQANIDVQGFSVEYEPMGAASETVTTSG